MDETLKRLIQNDPEGVKKLMNNGIPEVTSSVLNTKCAICNKDTEEWNLCLEETIYGQAWICMKCRSDALNILINEEAINLAKTGTIPVTENKLEISREKALDRLHVIGEDLLNPERKSDKCKDLKLIKKGLILVEKLNNII